MMEALSHSAPSAADWLPFAKAAGFFFATFVLEDAAAIGAGLLIATGGISWPAAIAACFLGIWCGDTGLYAVARYAGRGWFERSSLNKFRDKVARSERWFARRGTAILVFSRMVPGARLPTYFAAGFLRVPLLRFLFVTGVASFFWTLVVLTLSRTFGEQLFQWLSAYKHAGLLVVIVGLGGFVLLQFAPRLFKRLKGVLRKARGARVCDPQRHTTAKAHENSSRGGESACCGSQSRAPGFGRRALNVRRWAVALNRWRHWEFWPAWMFYPPVAIYCLWLCVKYRGLTVVTAANPGMFSGGFVGESKMETLRELMATNPEFTADAELVGGSNAKERFASLKEICVRRGISYPFILKPDVGQRGVGVKLIRSEEQALEYLEQTTAALIVQRYVEGPSEIGVFYYHFPNEARGHVFAITEKVFPFIIGDGRSTISELIWNDPRARYMADKYLRRLKGREEDVLAEGEALKLVEAGNHAQGCIFRDGRHLCTPELVTKIDEISQKLTGFFIGRYDIRYSNEADLRAGMNFQIIELNGAASEATSIYDARKSLLDAYRTLFRQWDLVFAIGAVNRLRGCAPTEFSLVWKNWRDYSRQAATYPAAD
jgi:membrane protein DedA with SNARE-associated domain